MSVVDSALGLLRGHTDPIDAAPETVFDVLANQRRRLVIHAFAEADGEPLTLKGLTTAIAAAENDCPPRELTGDQRKRVYVGLYQTHVDQLLAAGVVEPVADSHGAHVYRGTATAAALDEIAREVEGRCAREDGAVGGLDVPASPEVSEE